MTIHIIGSGSGAVEMQTVIYVRLQLQAASDGDSAVSAVAPVSSTSEDTCSSALLLSSLVRGHTAVCSKDDCSNKLLICAPPANQDSPSVTPLQAASHKGRDCSVRALLCGVRSPDDILASKDAALHHKAGRSTALQALLRALLRRRAGLRCTNHFSP